MASSAARLRRIAVVGSLVTLAVGAFASSASAATVDDLNHHRATINTYKGWQQNWSVTPFGCPDTTTYGETITVPQNKHEITKFSFYMNDGGATGSMKARGEIYAWNGTMATGSAIAETRAQTIDLPDALWHGVTFKFDNATVTPGATYVVFASIDKNYGACTNYTVAWGGQDDTTYTGGTFVFQNNAGNESNWTTSPWFTAGLDAVLKGYLS